MKQRIVAIDALRGFALLGILLMNISSYALPSIAYFNPTVYGGDELWNRLVFSLSHILADQKMMALFSMLFGASVMLVTGKMEKQGQSPLKFHYVRNFWLLIIGLIHSVFIWDGDILVVYALCSFALYWLRRLPPQWQLGLGLFVFFVPSFLSVGISSVLPHLETADWRYLESYWQPTATAVTAEIERYRGSYAGQVAHRLEKDSAATPYTTGQGLLEMSLLVEFFSRALGMMLVGMAFYTWGILTAQRSNTFYRHMALWGFGVGLPLTFISLYQYNAHNWDAFYSLFTGRIPNHIATPFVASGYLALVMLWSRSGFLADLHGRLAAVGRMALTNYIGQSLIATFIFYGFGLGLFGAVSRVQLWLIVLLIWGGQTFFSTWWLRHFRYGPLEWVWRCLSYWRWQPIHKNVVSVY